MGNDFGGRVYIVAGTIITLAIKHLAILKYIFDSCMSKRIP